MDSKWTTVHVTVLECDLHSWDVNLMKRIQITESGGGNVPLLGPTTDP